MEYACFARRLTALLLAAFPIQSALAFGNEGHEIVAGIAYAHLEAPVKKKVDALLAADQDKLTAPDFLARATWADKFRDSDKMHDKVHYTATHYWHYVDINVDGVDVDTACNHRPALAEGQVASQGPANDCVLDKLEQFSAELGDPATKKAENILALKFIMHFTGDLHQPLHAAERNNDHGGNLVAVLYRKKTVQGNLHSYWDTDLVKRLGSDPTKAAAKLNQAITPEQEQSWTQGTIASWALESHQLAKDVAYKLDDQKMLKDKNGVDCVYLDATYDARAIPVVNEQLSKAGIRLAKIINDALR